MSEQIEAGEITEDPSDQPVEADLAKPSQAIVEDSSKPSEAIVEDTVEQQNVIGHAQHPSTSVQNSKEQPMEVDTDAVDSQDTAQPEQAENMIELSSDPSIVTLSPEPNGNANNEQGGRKRDRSTSPTPSSSGNSVIDITPSTSGVPQTGKLKRRRKEHCPSQVDSDEDPEYLTQSSSGEQDVVGDSLDSDNDNVLYAEHDGFTVKYVSDPNVDCAEDDIESAEDDPEDGVYYVENRQDYAEDEELDAEDGDQYEDEDIEQNAEADNDQYTEEVTEEYTDEGDVQYGEDDGDEYAEDEDQQYVDDDSQQHAEMETEQPTSSNIPEYIEEHYSDAESATLVASDTHKTSEEQHERSTPSENTINNVPEAAKRIGGAQTGDNDVLLESESVEQRSQSDVDVSDDHDKGSTNDIEKIKESGNGGVEDVIMPESTEQRESSVEGSCKSGKVQKTTVEASQVHASTSEVELLSNGKKSATKHAEGEIESAEMEVDDDDKVDTSKNPVEVDDENEPKQAVRPYEGPSHLDDSPDEADVEDNNDLLPRQRDSVSPLHLPLASPERSDSLARFDRVYESDGSTEEYSESESDVESVKNLKDSIQNHRCEQAHCIATGSNLYVKYHGAYSHAVQATEFTDCLGNTYDLVVQDPEAGQMTTIDIREYLEIGGDLEHIASELESDSDSTEEPDTDDEYVIRQVAKQQKSNLDLYDVENEPEYDNSEEDENAKQARAEQFEKEKQKMRQFHAELSGLTLDKLHDLPAHLKPYKDSFVVDANDSENGIINYDEVPEVASVVGSENRFQWDENPTEEEELDELSLVGHSGSHGSSSKAGTSVHTIDTEVAADSVNISNKSTFVSSGSGRRVDDSGNSNAIGGPIVNNQFNFSFFYQGRLQYVTIVDDPCEGPSHIGYDPYDFDDPFVSRSSRRDVFMRPVAAAHEVEEVQMIPVTIVDPSAVENDMDIEEHHSDETASTAIVKATVQKTTEIVAREVDDADSQVPMEVDLTNNGHDKNNGSPDEAIPDDDYNSAEDEAYEDEDESEEDTDDTSGYDDDLSKESTSLSESDPSDCDYLEPTSKIEHPDYRSEEEGYEYDEKYTEVDKDLLPGFCAPRVHNYVPREKPAYMHRSRVNRPIDASEQLYDELQAGKSANYALIDPIEKELANAMRMNYQMQISFIEEIARLVCNGRAEYEELGPIPNIEPSECIHPESPVKPMAYATELCSEKDPEGLYVHEVWWAWIESNLPKSTTDDVDQLRQELENLTVGYTREDSPESGVDDDDGIKTPDADNEVCLDDLTFEFDLSEISEFLKDGEYQVQLYAHDDGKGGVKLSANFYEQEVESDDDEYRVNEEEDGNDGAVEDEEGSMEVHDEELAEEDDPEYDDPDAALYYAEQLPHGQPKDTLLEDEHQGERPENEESSAPVESADVVLSNEIEPAKETTPVVQDVEPESQSVPEEAHNVDATLNSPVLATTDTPADVIQDTPQSASDAVDGDDNVVQGADNEVVVTLQIERASVEQVLSDDEEEQIKVLDNLVDLQVIEENELADGTDEDDSDYEDHIERSNDSGDEEDVDGDETMVSQNEFNEDNDEPVEETSMPPEEADTEEVTAEASGEVEPSVAETFAEGGSTDEGSPEESSDDMSDDEEASDATEVDSLADDAEVGAQPDAADANAPVANGESILDQSSAVEAEGDYDDSESEDEDNDKFNVYYEAEGPIHPEEPSDTCSECSDCQRQRESVSPDTHRETSVITIEDSDANVPTNNENTLINHENSELVNRIKRLNMLRYDINPSDSLRRTIRAFKSNNPELPLRTSDAILLNYRKYRKRHSTNMAVNKQRRTKRYRRFEDVETPPLRHYQLARSDSSDDSNRDDSSDESTASAPPKSLRPKAVPLRRKQKHLILTVRRVKKLRPHMYYSFDPNDFGHNAKGERLRRRAENIRRRRWGIRPLPELKPPTTKPVVTHPIPILKTIPKNRHNRLRNLQTAEVVTDGEEDKKEINFDMQTTPDLSQYLNPDDDNDWETGPHYLTKLRAIKREVRANQWNGYTSLSRIYCRRQRAPIHVLKANGKAFNVPKNSSMVIFDEHVEPEEEHISVSNAVSPVPPIEDVEMSTASERLQSKSISLPTAVRGQGTSKSPMENLEVAIERMSMTSERPKSPLPPTAVADDRIPLTEDADERMSVTSNRPKSKSPLPVAKPADEPQAGLISNVQKEKSASILSVQSRSNIPAKEKLLAAKPSKKSEYGTNDNGYSGMFNDMKVFQNGKLKDGEFQFHENGTIPEHLLEYCTPILPKDGDCFHDTWEDVINEPPPPDVFFSFMGIDLDADIVNNLLEGGVLAIDPETNKVYDTTENETILNIKKPAESKLYDEDDQENEEESEINKELAEAQAELEAATLQLKTQNNTILKLMKDHAKRHELTEMLKKTEATLFDNADADPDEGDPFDMAFAYDDLYSYYKDQKYGDLIQKRAQKHEDAKAFKQFKGFPTGY